MKQESHTLAVACDAETLWTVLSDMVRNPARYEDKVTCKDVSPSSNDKLVRRIERKGRIEVEEIEFHHDALMVEITCPARRLTLIHQIVPMGDASILNLAANEELVDGEEAEAETGTPDLERLGARIRKMAEQLSK